MAITIRPMGPEEGRVFLEIHSRTIRGLAANHYPAPVIDAWALRATDENVKRLLSNPDGEIRLIAELDGEPVGLGSLFSPALKCEPATSCRKQQGAVSGRP